MGFYGVMHACFGWLVRLIHRVEVNGKENIEDGRNYLFCSNHMSFSDPIVIASVIKSKLRFMAKKELIVIPVAGGILRLFGAFPVDRKGNDVGAIKKSVEMLKNGENLLMFVQGTRCPGVLPSTTEPKGGCVLIAERSGADIIPVHVETKGYRQGFLKKTYVTFGEPIRNGDVNGLDYKSGAKYVFEKITKEEGRHQ